MLEQTGQYSMISELRVWHTWKSMMYSMTPQLQTSAFFPAQSRRLVPSAVVACAPGTSALGTLSETGKLQHRPEAQAISSKLGIGWSYARG